METMEDKLNFIIGKLGEFDSRIEQIEKVQTKLIASMTETRNLVSTQGEFMRLAFGATFAKLERPYKGFGGMLFTPKSLDEE